MLGGLASLGEQLLYQRTVPLEILLGAALRSFDTASKGCDPQLIVPNLQHHLVSNVDTEGLSERGRDYDSAILIDSCPNHMLHDITPPTCHKCITLSHFQLS
jgi:hypothetical protein